MKKIICTVLSLMMIASLLIAPAMAEAPMGPVMEKVKTSGKLIVGTEATYPPYEYLDDNAQLAGCDIWLANQIADALGVAIEWSDMEFDGIIPAVQSGLVDIGIAAFTKTPERAESIDFTDLYETSAQLLIVKAGNADKYATKEAMAGLQVGAQQGTIQSQLIEKALPDSKLFELKTYPELALETINGNIVGFVVDYAVGMSMIASSDGNLEVSSFEFTAEEASFGKACVVAKGNEDFIAAVNEVIAKVLEDGSYQAAYEAAVAATGETGE